MRVTIEKLVYGGSGLARTPEGKVVFVPYTLWGETCTVELVENKRDFARARLLKIEEPSKDRIDPLCPLFTQCGGCQLQHIAYQDQLEWKRDCLKETIEGMASIEVSPRVVPSPQSVGYRAKATFHVDSKGRLGFFQALSHTVVEVKKCPLLSPQINATLSELEGLIPSGVHTVDVVCDVETGKTTALFYTDRAELDVEIGLGGTLKGFELRQKRKFQRGRGRLLYSRGSTECSYRVDDIRLFYSPSVFFQVNTLLNRRLVEEVLQAVGDGGTTVVDAFCGVGNFSLPLAKRGHRVYGFDVDPVAIGYAKRAAEQNNLEGAYFFVADAERGKVLEKIASSVVVLDPPRGGCRGFSIKVATERAARVVYVSCNPSTLGRDLREFIKRGYRVEDICLVDMFPQTYHIESITVLTL